MTIASKERDLFLFICNYLAISSVLGTWGRSGHSSFSDISSVSFFENKKLTKNMEHLTDLKEIIKTNKQFDMRIEAIS